MGRIVHIVPYDPTWPEAFERETEAIRGALGGLEHRIFHIGSTAVPGMAAKPIIDILLAVRSLAQLGPFGSQWQRLGYTALGEFGMAGRRFYCKGGGDHTHHVHAFEFGSPEIGRHLRFRDFLRESGEDAKAYAALKETLAQRYKADPIGYGHAKTAFIRRIDARARQRYAHVRYSSPRS